MPQDLADGLYFSKIGRIFNKKLRIFCWLSNLILLLNHTTCRCFHSIHSKIYIADIPEEKTLPQWNQVVPYPLLKKWLLFLFYFCLGKVHPLNLSGKHVIVCFHCLSSSFVVGTNFLARFLYVFWFSFFFFCCDFFPRKVFACESCWVWRCLGFSHFMPLLMASYFHDSLLTQP